MTAARRSGRRGDTAARKVVFVREELLPVSQTFVRAQQLGLGRWEACLLGVSRAAPSLDLSMVPHRALLPAPGGPLARRAAAVVRRLGLARQWLAHALRRERPDLVHVHFGVDLVRLWPVLSRLRVPVVVTLHGYDIQIDGRWWDSGAAGPDLVGYHARLVAIVSRPNVHVVAVSQAIRRRALEVGVPDDRMRVLHIGVDTRFFDGEAPPLGLRPPRVLFVGRLTEKKGLPVLLQAAARARAAVPGLQVEVVGDGEEREAYVRLAAELQLDCRFLGARDAAGVRDAIAGARVLCLPSVTAANGDAEGLGLVLLEAQAAGVPVLTSACGGVDEALIEGVTGHAFAEGDVARLAELIAALLPDTARLERMSQDARRFARERHELRTCCAELERFYDALLDGSATARPARAPAPGRGSLTTAPMALPGGSPARRPGER